MNNDCKGEAHTNAFIDYCPLCIEPRSEAQRERERVILRLGILAGHALTDLHDLERLLQTDGVYPPEVAAELRAAAAELHAGARMLVVSMREAFRAAQVKP
jgi:hypothetical protein